MYKGKIQIVEREISMEVGGWKQLVDRITEQKIPLTFCVIEDQSNSKQKAAFTQVLLKNFIPDISGFIERPRKGKFT